MNGDLNQLHDIVVPDPILYWPLAQGWYALFIVILSFLIPWLVKINQKRRTNAYRRNAISELDSIAHIKAPTVKLLKLFDLLKRTALTACPREQVASLSGDAWWDFLYQTSKVKFAPASQESIQEVLYNPDFKPPENSCKKFEKEVRQWINKHRSPDYV